MAMTMPQVVDVCLNERMLQMQTWRCGDVYWVAIHVKYGYFKRSLGCPCMLCDCVDCIQEQFLLKRLILCLGDTCVINSPSVIYVHLKT